MSEFLQRLPEFIGNHPFLSFGFIGVVVAMIAMEINKFTRGYKTLTPAGLTQLVNRNNALLIDVSSIQDYEKGHVPGARHVAMSQFDPENKDLAKAKDLPVAIYCKTGQTSGSAAKRLKKAGFSDVYTLEGGLRSWMEAQLPLAKGRSAN
ncbi:MAG TPA: rhodanese-like domain-containing protein [Dokdonella sp.]|uniref:rhodanese-like domain-containing protein n=1 Tax=Dokdonella sp. TaxID=2291710 RepID=UPI002D7EAFE6|nr:rhodanese-like domain-containing protein [Dokdonella sp.]HET9034470.1 rhodanese-like domain-containing protein [Dokdonella sp.]